LKDVTQKDFADGRFFVIGVIAWLGTMQLLGLVLPLLGNSSEHLLRNSVSLVVVGVTLFFFYKGRKFARLLVIVMLLGSSFMRIYKEIIADPDSSVSTWKVIYYSIMLICGLMLIYWHPAKVYFGIEKGRDWEGSGDSVLPSDVAWLFPPKEVHDPQAWDTYWRNQLEHGMGPEIFDMFCHDSQLVKLAHNSGLSTILCIGNGISMEPLALSHAGFQVTAMDLSPFAVRFCRQIAKDNANNTDAVKHYMDQQLLRPSGSVEFVVGDIFDPTCCSGPFDIIIERRTIQDYPEPERIEGVSRLLARLATPGVLFSHCHDNRWNPVKNPDSRPIHVTRPIVLELGLTELDVEPTTILDKQYVMFFTSTG